MIDFGITNFNVNINAGADYLFTVNFNKTFPNPPVVLLSTDNTAFTYQLQRGGITKTSFNGFVEN